MPIVFYCEKCWTELSIPEDVGITEVECECGHFTPLPEERNIVFIPTGKEVLTYEDETPECIEVIVAHDLSVIPVFGALIYLFFYIITAIKLGTRGAEDSYWLRKGAERLWAYNVRPVVWAIVLLILPLTIVVVVSVPSFGGNGRGNNDNAAQAMLKSIVTAQSTYTTKHKRYAPSLAALVTDGVLYANGFGACTASGVDSPVISGYIFQMTAGRTWTSTDFYVRCRPISDTAGTYSYSTDTNGKIVSTEAYQTTP